MYLSSWIEIDFPYLVGSLDVYFDDQIPIRIRHVLEADIS